MAIGNPINLTSNVEGKNISVIATAGQTQFTVTGGYRINQISVFRNGVRLVDGRDFTALDGSIVTLLSAATVADVIEFQVFDDFRVSDALNVNSGGTVNGNVTVTGILSTTNLSIGSSISLDATTGIITAVQVIGGTITGTATTAINAQGLTGTPDITVNNIVAAAGTFSGVLTYEDVTNIDSLGIVTARTGVDITANGLVVNAGVSTFGADLSIADKIIHSGDTNTAIRFPSNDTFTVETSGVQRLEVDSTGDLGLVGIATATGLVVVAGSGGYAGHTGIITAVTFDGALSGAATQVTVADESSDTTCFPLFATAATGDLAPKSGTNLTFNSSTGALTATSFVGAVTGDVTGSISGGTVAGSTGTFTGDVDIADKIVHTGDTNTAIRFPAADTFTVETAGSERLRINSSGNVGIGTDSPGALLSIQGGESATPRFAIENTTASTNDFTITQYEDGNGVYSMLGQNVKLDNGGNNSILDSSFRTAALQLDARNHGSVSIFTGDTNAVSERFRITSNGDVRIGTTNAVVFGSRRALTVANGTTGAVLSLYNSTTATDNPRISSNPGGSEINDIGIHAASTNGTIQFYTSNDTERLRIDSSGRLLVGATVEGAPAADNLTLEDSGDCGLTIRAGTSNYSTIYLSDATSGTGEYAGSFQYGHADNSLRIGTNSLERLRIDSSGRLLVGCTANPSNKNTVTPTVVVDGSGVNGALQINRHTSPGGGGSQLLLSGTRGSSVSSYTVVQSGDGLGTIDFMGADGGEFVTAAQIQCQVDGTPGDNDMPGRLTFSTTADGASSQTERLRIDSRGSFLFSNGFLAETVKINSTARTGTQAVNLDDGNVHYFTSSSTGTWKPNFALSTTPDINDTIATGDTFSVTMIVNKSNTAHYADSAQVDGSDITVEWLGGAPTDGGGNNTYDVYSYSIIKTGNDAFIAFASVSNYT